MPKLLPDGRMGVDLGNGLILHAPALTGTPLYALNTSKVGLQIAAHSLKLFFAYLNWFGNDVFVYFYLGCPNICKSIEYEPDFSDSGILISIFYLYLLRPYTSLRIILDSTNFECYRPSLWNWWENIFIGMCTWNGGMQT